MNATLVALRDYGDVTATRAIWNDLVARSGADVYATYDWSRIWWRYYGTGRHLHLLQFYHGGQLVGIIPAFTETLWLGPARVRVAKLVGADHTISVCNLAVLSDAFASAIRQAVHYFLGQQHCDLFLVGPLSGCAARIDDIISAGNSVPDASARVETLGSECNSFFYLPATFPEYLASLPKKPRGNLVRSLTLLPKQMNVAFDVIADLNRLGSEFEQFCQLHKAQWRPEGKLGHFGDWPNSEAFNRETMNALGALGMVQFHRIIANDRVVSSQFTLLFNKTSYWRLPARALGAEWDRFSLGRMGLAKMVEALLAQGVRTVEGGRGHYDYKVQLGAQEWPLRTIQFTRAGPTVATRVRLFRLAAAALNLTYHRIVFARLAPRIPFLRRAQSSLWIRSRW